MNKGFTLSVLISVLGAAQATSQDVFDLPVELTPPEAPLAFELDNAVVEVVLDPEASFPSLRARSMSEGGVATALAAVTLGEKVVLRSDPRMVPKRGHACVSSWCFIRTSRSSLPARTSTSRSKVPSQDEVGGRGRRR